MAKKKEELIGILREAKQKALASIDNKDGGTANFDSVIVYNESEKEFLSACKEVGLDCSEYDKGEINISPPDHRWQGYNRTVQAETMTKVLEKKGIKAYTKYVMD